MTRKILILLSVFAFAFATGKAQTPFCGTDIMHRKLLQEHPEMAQKIADDSARLETEIRQRIFDNKMKVNLDLSSVARLTGSDDADSIKPYVLEDTLFIPVVVHVIHNYGAEDVTDDKVYSMIKTLNDYYQLKNDTAASLPGGFHGIVPAFKKFVGRANIYFKLATKDPLGNPTRGITRRYTYTTYGGDNSAKYDLWAPSNYMNIWIEAVIGAGAEGGGIVAAYSQLPPDGASDPFIDGLIAAYPYIDQGNTGYVIAHEVGHYFNLLHPFGSNNVGSIAGGCGDDEVDDTPPTTGEFGEGTTSAQFYDTTCARGYVKLYPSSLPGVDSIYDYPDTANVQNIMTYSDFIPELMFTKGQVARMRAALASDIAHRDTLWSKNNLLRTGALDPVPDLPVIPDYSVSGGGSSSPTNWTPVPLNSNYGYATTFNGLFVCENQAVTFANKSWNDTLVSTDWSFSNGATPATATTTAALSVANVKFTQPGWVTVRMDVSGNNTSTQTLIDSQKLFVADPNATNAVGYFQEFNSGADLAKWPTFNYYNNDFKWQLNNNTGYYDNTCMEYVGFDSRIYPANLTGPAHVSSTGVGDYDDMFTPVFDLSSVKNGADSAYLTFMYSGATRTGYSQYINDTLEIAYNTGCGPVWRVVANLTKSNLITQGALSIPYAPQGMAQWNVESVNIPDAALTNSTVFRFRYKPRTDQYGNSSGNNFFMDRIHFTNYRALLDVNTANANGMNIVISPNPTKSNAYVLIADAANATVNVQVTDITGKVVYSVEQKNTNTQSRIEIPHAAIAVSGVYLVHVNTNNQVRTEKLVVY